MVEIREGVEAPRLEIARNLEAKSGLFANRDAGRCNNARSCEARTEIAGDRVPIRLDDRLEETLAYALARYRQGSGWRLRVLPALKKFPDRI
jgi:hypothetical protein